VSEWIETVSGTPIPGGDMLMAADLFRCFPAALLLPADS
jgi:hypothetical protein